MTIRRPWPDWCAVDYYRLTELASRVIKNANIGLETQYQNIYLTSKCLSRLAGDGQAIVSIVKQIELNKDDGERMPNWVNDALRIGKTGGRYISAGAKHGLQGMQDDNWKMVVKGLSTCLDYAYKIELALLQGPRPEPDDILKTLETLKMGRSSLNEQGDGRWKRQSNK